MTKPARHQFDVVHSTALSRRESAFGRFFVRNAFLILAFAVLFALSPDATRAEPGETVERPTVSHTQQMRSDWVGFHNGTLLGMVRTADHPSRSDTSPLVGLWARSDRDLNQIVVGGGVDLDFADADMAGPTADLRPMLRPRLRAGVQVGEGLIYGTGGAADARSDTLGWEAGYFLGAGYERFVGPGITLGTEVLIHDSDDVSGTSVDFDATTFQLRGTFRF